MNDIDPQILLTLNLLADDKETIAYRKRLNNITGSVTATILLQQMIYWAKIEGFQPFYKFRSPCKNPLYKEGDSWTEELGFSIAEFDTAIKKIGTKITKGVSKSEAYQGKTIQHIIIYWTDSSRITWYHLNVNLLGKLIMSLYLENRESASTKKREKVDLPLSETTRDYTQTTTEEGAGAKNAPPTHDYLTDVFNGNVNSLRPGISDPSRDVENYMQTADEWLKTYRTRTGLWPDSNVQKPAICDLATKPDADLSLWDRVVTAWVKHGWNKRNVAGMIEFYERGEVPSTGKNGGKHAAHKRPDPNQTYFDPERGLVRRDPTTGELVPVS